jgi:hypothetical protein
MVLQKTGTDLPALPALTTTGFPPAHTAKGNRRCAGTKGSTLRKPSYLGLSAFASRFGINHSSASRATERGTVWGPSNSL